MLPGVMHWRVFISFWWKDQHVQGQWGNHSEPRLHTAATQERGPNQFLRASQGWEHQGSDNMDQHWSSGTWATMNHTPWSFSPPSDDSLTSHPAWCAVCVDNMPAGIFFANTFKHHYTNKAQPKSVPVPETIRTSILTASGIPNGNKWLPWHSWKDAKQKPLKLKRGVCWNRWEHRLNIKNMRVTGKKKKNQFAKLKGKSLEKQIVLHWKVVYSS